MARKKRMGVHMHPKRKHAMAKRTGHAALEISARGTHHMGSKRQGPKRGGKRS